ncbi:MAG: choice-of-anchor R domain-containing protein [Armatimonadota bacterium]
MAANDRPCDFEFGAPKAASPAAVPDPQKASVIANVPAPQFPGFRFIDVPLVHRAVADFAHTFPHPLQDPLPAKVLVFASRDTGFQGMPFPRRSRHGKECAEFALVTDVRKGFIMTSHPRFLAAVVALVALGLSAPRAAHADEIFSNLGAPRPGFGGLAIERNQEIAQDFVTGPNSYSNIVFQGRFQYSSGTNGLTLRLHRGGSLLPDDLQILAISPSLLAPDTTDIVTWVLDPSVTLEANSTYWFSAGATSENGLHRWEWNNIGDDGSAIRLGGQDWFSSDNEPFKAASAFRVTGTLVPATGSEVPEPSEWAAIGILGSGLVGLIARKRRKN